MKINYYEILDVPEDSDEIEIKVAYRKLAIKYHPDKNPGDKNAEEKFRIATEAYETLKDEVKRKKYDAQNIKPKKHRYGSNLRISINVTRLELIQNIRKLIVIKRKGLCKVCLGTGSANKISKKCIYCNGTGLQGLSLVLGTKKNCQFCGGVGKIPDGPSCSACKGSALEPEVIHQSLVLNPYMEIVRLPNLGNFCINGKPGDLIVNLIIKEDPHYRVNDLDVTGKIEISPAQAVLGDEISLKVFRKTINIKIPPGAQNGQRIELKNKGITYKKEIGDFRGIIRIKIPTIISDKEKLMYQQLLEIEKEAPCLRVLSF